MNKTNLLVWEMSFLNFLVDIKEIMIGGGTFSMLYNFLPKVNITPRGLESYMTCRFQKYSWPKRTSQISMGEISHNNESLKVFMP
jgi:hypothetical protein